MTLSEELNWRGQIKDKTFLDDTWLDSPKCFYLGADCSSDSLTIGNLAVFMLARRLRKAGWRAVLLVGGATSLIGDPGGKDEERALKSREEIAANVQGIRGQVVKLFSGMDFELVDNFDWFKDVGYLQFLREVGKHYSMTELVQRDYISQRLGENASGISYAEFSYSLIQGYDYWHLYKEFGVELQIGGSDQWGNMLSGVPLIRKKEAIEVHAMSMPLVIDKSTGKKFGKSEEGAIWLDPLKTTPTQFYQFWINTDDDAVADHLKIFTDLDKQTIDKLVESHSHDKTARTAQVQLAYEVTSLVHGSEQAMIAEQISAYLVGKMTLVEATDETLRALRAEIPSVESTPGGSILQALVAGGMAESISEARRLLQGNAISINGAKVVRENFDVSDFQGGRLLMKKGKKFKDTVLVENPNE